MDVELRRLERLVSSGEIDAADALLVAWRRAGQPESPIIWFLLLQELTPVKHISSLRWERIQALGKKVAQRNARKARRRQEKSSSVFRQSALEAKAKSNRELISSYGSWKYQRCDGCAKETHCRSVFRRNFISPFRKTNFPYLCKDCLSKPRKSSLA